MQTRGDGAAAETLPTRTWTEVDLGVVRSNAAALRRLTGQGGQPMAVVKADAYGHGAVPIARACAAGGIRHFGVASVAEGRELRQAGIDADIYILPSTLPEEAVALVRWDLIPFVSSWMQMESLRAASAHAPIPARCVLAIDTGMGREGCLPDEARAIYRALCADGARGTVRLAGIATHFSCADEPGWGDDVTAKQGERYFETLHQLDAIAPLANFDDGRGGRGVYLTLANSPGTLRWTPPVSDAPPGTRGFLARCGLLIYGIAPYPEPEADMQGLRPVLSWRARVTLVRDMPAGATIGYGQTHTLTRPSRIATLAVGYADGLSRKLSNRGVISLHGARYKIVGRVSMDQCQIDVTPAGHDAAVAVGDVATLIGSDGDQTLTVAQMSEASETTPHEPTCRLTARVPRIYRGGD